MATKEPLWVIHRMSGRIRLRFADTKQDVPDLDAILDIPGVEEVRYNKITKSLLVIYDAGALSEKALLSQFRKRLGNVRLILKAPKSEERSVHGNLLSLSIYDLIRKTNNRTNRVFGGAADLTSIIPVAMMAWGLEELIRNPMMPKWYDIWRAAHSTLDSFSQQYK